MSRNNVMFGMQSILYFIIICWTLILTGCGGGGSNSGSNSPVSTSLQLFAGNLDGTGYLNGIGAAAIFSSPSGIATDASGNVYVTDSSNNTIRKITPAGVVTTFAGTAGMIGSADGTGAAASFNYPRGIATDTFGNVYVTDIGDHIIRKITPAGVVTILAGTAAWMGSADGTGAAARFSTPSGVATDASGNVYVTDSDNQTIRKVTSTGVVTTLAGTAGVSGNADGTGAVARFSLPLGIATDSSGNVFVADSRNHTIRKITPAGVVTTLAGTAGVSGSVDGIGAAAIFSSPSGVATDVSGNVYVTDSSNYTIRRITPAGEVTTLAGTAGVIGSVDGIGAAARFSSLSGVATDASGSVYVTEFGNQTIRKITPVGLVTTFAGTAGVSGSADGTGAAAGFASPFGVATHASGNVFVADSSNHTIRKITPVGVVTTFAGTAGVIGSADGTGAAASFNYPSDIASDAFGNLYVSDTFNHTIRKITPVGVVTTFAGTAGVIGSADGTGATASFNYPSGIASDTFGNVYVTDSGNRTIRKITPAGVVTTFAGTAGVIGSADGTGAAASFYFASSDGIATDAFGNVYVTDIGNHTIRKITPVGVVTTFAGTAGVSGSADGTGAAASFYFPRAIAADAFGNLYVPDNNNHTIRKITPAGLVSTVQGLPWWAKGIAVDGRNLYLTMNNGVALLTNVP